MTRIERLKPVNRHLLIVPHFRDNKTESGVPLPEDFQPEKDQYTEATVIDISDDCSGQFKHLKYEMAEECKRVVVDTSMIQKVTVKGASHYLILENYVVGLYKVPDAG